MNCVFAKQLAFSNLASRLYMVSGMNIRIFDRCQDGAFGCHTVCKSWSAAMEWIDEHNRISIRIIGVDICIFRG